MTQSPTPPTTVTPSSAPGPVADPVRARRSWRWVAFKWLFGLLVLVVLLVAAYLFFVLKWSYSSGERAGWVQKLSHKGWFCKTWEGELAMVSMPGATPEKFYFTVWSDEVAEQINRNMGKRVALHYEEKIGIPTTCFGETRHFVTKVTVVDQIPLAPGVVVPTQPSAGGSTQPAPATGQPAAPQPGTPQETQQPAPPPAAPPAPNVSPPGPAAPPAPIPAPAPATPAPAPATPAPASNPASLESGRSPASQEAVKPEPQAPTGSRP